MKNKAPLTISRLTILLLLFTFQFSLSYCQDLTLEQCFQHALDNNLDLQNGVYEVKKNKLELKRIRDQRLPSITLGSSLYTSGNAVDPTNNSFVASRFIGQRLYASGNYMILDWGENKLQRRKEKKVGETLQYQNEVLKREIKRNVLVQYSEILVLSKVLLILREAVNESEQILKINATLRERGVKSKKDILELEVQLYSEKIQLEETKYNLLKMKNQFAIYLGIKEVIELYDDGDYEVKKNDGALIDIWKLEHPSYKAMISSGRQLELNLKVLDRRRIPKLSFSTSIGTNYSSLARQLASESRTVVYDDYLLNGETIQLGQESSSFEFIPMPYSTQLESNLFYSFSLGVNYPVLDKNRLKYEKQKALLEREQVHLQAEVIERSLQLELSNYQIEVDELSSVLEINNKLITKASALFKLKESEFISGKLSGYEYILLKQELQRQKIRAAVSRIKLYFKNQEYKYL